MRNASFYRCMPLILHEALLLATRVKQTMPHTIDPPPNCISLLVTF